ncbi:hypothetical protein I3760_04G053200 [Carya illinoinensis]|nr:hypothetical protein I3760_04G053200 [Carya illinoinensis]
MVGETSKKLGHFDLLVTVLMMMMIFSPYTTRWGATASSIQLDNGTRTALDYQGRMEEPELLFDSEISRMLTDYQSFSYGSMKPGAAIAAGCSTSNQKYCLPNAVNNRGDCRSSYGRACGRPH